MYALIHKNKVIAGPIAWNRAFFSFKLKELGLNNIQLPRLAESSTHIVNSETKIVSVVSNVEDHNSKIQYIQGPSWEILENYAIAHYVAVDTPLEFVRANFKSELAEARYYKEIAGITINIQEIDVSIDTSREGRNIFIQTASIMQDSDIIAWKFPETWLNVNKPEMLLIISKGVEHIQNCFNWEKSISEIIDAAQSAEELLAIHDSSIAKKE